MALGDSSMIVIAAIGGLLLVLEEVVWLGMLCLDPVAVVLESALADVIWGITLGALRSKIPINW